MSRRSVTKDCLDRMIFSIWRHRVEQVFLGYNQNKSQHRVCITCLSSRAGEGEKGPFCLHLRTTSVHNLRNFFEKIILPLEFLS